MAGESIVCITGEMINFNNPLLKWNVSHYIVLQPRYVSFARQTGWCLFILNSQKCDSYTNYIHHFTTWMSGMSHELFIGISSYPLITANASRAPVQSVQHRCCSEKCPLPKIWKVGLSQENSQTSDLHWLNSFLYLWYLKIVVLLKYLCV